MKKLLDCPLFGPIIGMLFFVAFGLCAWYSYFCGTGTFMEDGHAGDIWTYLMYVFALGSIIYCVKDFKGKYQDYILFLFLMLCGVFREAGIQHILTTTDTTAFKYRFFTNPNNPLWEKCRAAFLLITVLGAAGIVLFKYFPKIWHGFWNKTPMYWTICALGAFGVICKIADRIPSKYSSFEGHRMSDIAIYWYSITEEGLEMCLPLLVMIAVFQYHFSKEKG